MHRSNWRFIAAVAGWLLLVAAGPHTQQAANTEQHRRGNAVADALTNIARTYAKQAEDAERSPESDPCQPGQDNRMSDLCAQWKAADAADTAAWWARFSGVLSFAGLFGVAGALLLTVQSNRLSRDTAERQLRAYVSLASTKLDPLKDAEGNPFWEIQSIWTNNGSTPARQATAMTNWQDFDPNGMQPDFNFPSQSLTIQTDPINVGPNGTLHARAPKIPGWLIDTVLLGQRRVYIWGWVSYDDVFAKSPRRRTEFCYELKLEQVQGKLGIGFDPVTRHNAVDEDCVYSGT